jgi:hypothetical protein
MVGAPGSPALTLPGGPPSMFLSVDGGRSWIPSSGTSQGVHHQRFLALMVDASGSTAPAPPRGPTVSTRQGGHRRRFLALMFDAFGSPSAPLRGPTIIVSWR